MGYILYSTLIRDSSDLYLDFLEEFSFPTDESKYHFLEIQEKQDLMELAIILYDDVTQWKMIAILNNIEDPMLSVGMKIRVVKSEFLEDITNV